MSENKQRWAVGVGLGVGNISVEPCEDGYGFPTKLEAIERALAEAEHIRACAAQSAGRLKRQRAAEIRKAAKAEGIR